MPKLVVLIALLLLTCLVSAEVFPVPVGKYQPQCYTAYKPVEPIVADGKLNESSWQIAPWTADFVDIEGAIKPAPHLKTRVKMLWDEQWLYIAAEMQEPHIWAKLTQRDAVIFYDNDFEVFIDPDGDTHDYYELEINALGTLWDLFLIKPYRDRDQVAVNAWDIKGIEYGIGLNGTLNDPSDTDEAWFLELKIPMAVLAECAHMPIPPKQYDFWRVNFSRVQWQTDVVAGEYIKKAGVPENNWVWSPQGLIAMHYPERWGYLFFSHAQVDMLQYYERAGLLSSWMPENFSFPPQELVREHLRQLYYRQKQFYMDNKRYAKSLELLAATPCLWEGEELPLTLETTSQGYVISSPKRKGLPAYCIREDGLIWTPRQ